MFSLPLLYGLGFCIRFCVFYLLALLSRRSVLHAPASFFVRLLRSVTRIVSVPFPFPLHFLIPDTSLKEYYSCRTHGRCVRVGVRFALRAVRVSHPRTRPVPLADDEGLCPQRQRTVSVYNSTQRYYQRLT